MSGEVIPFPKNDHDWDGDPTQATRWTAKTGVIDASDEAAYADDWVAYLGLPPRLDGELWHQWATRTEKERGVGVSATELSSNPKEETA